MTVIILASIIGGLSSALRFYKQGLVQVMRIFVSSAALAYFGGADLAAFVHEYLNVSVSIGFSCFLLAYSGSTLLDRFILFIKAFRVSKKWSS
jgi:uncharacterized membrane protein YfcA